ncbi:prepilin-type N-terminal cleavage/methylation domain-containing protein [Lyngbya aestuarii]|uniref:prepilin-type N-terminal cleavage/methylation domain-containing protein n=1 Tax=Lyngbya aestuarii TaxID=118322 RepID=UPI00403DF04E
MKKLPLISPIETTAQSQHLTKHLARLLRMRSHAEPNSGFTLLEIIVVVLIIAILSAITAPSWFGFLSQRRANAASEAVWSSLQRAQSEAKRRKLSYSVSFRTDNGVPQVATYLAKDQMGNIIDPGSLAANSWEALGKDFQLQPGQVVLGTNLTGENQGDDNLEYAKNAPQKQTITFDYQGNLDPQSNLNIPDKGLIIAVAVPQPGNNDEAITSTQRCVKVKTIIGSMQTGKGEECNAD